MTENLKLNPESGGNQSVYFWFAENQELLAAPQSVVLDAALAVTAEHLHIKQLEILSPTPDTIAVDGRRLALLLLDQTSIGYSVLAAELGYTSEKRLENAIDRAYQTVEDDPSLRNRLDIVTTKMKRQVENWQTTADDANDREGATNQPYLSPELQELYQNFRAYDKAAAQRIDEQFDGLVTEVLEGHEGDVPAEIIDAAWEAFHEHVQNADLRSPANFEAAARQKIAAKIAEVIELHRAAEAVMDLDIRQYLRDMEEFDVSIGKRPIKTQLDQAAIETAVTTAMQRLDARFQRDNDYPIQDFFTLKPTSLRPTIRGEVVKYYRQDIARKVKLSALMVEQGKTDFQLVKMPVELFDKFVDITIDDCAKTVIEHYRRLRY